MLGLGYRFFFNREESTLRLKLGYSHYIMLPLNLFNLKIKSKRRLGKTYILISCISKVYLCFIASILLNYRKLNIYKLKGIYPKNYLKIKSLKQGKKKSLT
jgi:ribosomal protein L6P/L9E